MKPGVNRRPNDVKIRIPVRHLAAVAALAVATALHMWPVSTSVRAETPGSYFDQLTFRTIGPATFGGRISDFAVHEANPSLFYVAVSTGALWKTGNGGTTWEVLFADQPDAVSIGDIAIAQDDPDLVWIGTGENNNRQSSSWGNGVYKSTDGGRTWAHLGLEDTRHIGRIVIHPVDHDIVYVAATGSLWGPHEQRGVFRTTDGGRTWEKLLYVDEFTGATELVMDPSNPLVLYAGTYQRQRAPWGFNGGGPGSGIHKTTDGGRTWRRLAGGLPQGDIGRIGMDVYRADPRVLYARVEHASAGGVYRTDDGGETWQHMSPENPRPMYFSQIRVDPRNHHRVYMLGVALHISDDGGRTWVVNRSAVQDGLWPPGNAINSSIHSDQHAMWINPHNPDHMLIGNDGGVLVSWDRSLTWRMFDNMDLAQIYHVGFDMDVPYRVYIGMQDNLSWGGPSATRSWLGIGNDDWFLIGGGDGFVSFADPTDSNIIYTESQNGNILRVDRRTNERKSIRPVPAAGDPPLRFNWDTPFLLSAHDPKTLYIGAERVFRTRDRGHSWQAISGDLTTNADREALSLMGVQGKEIRLSKNDGVSFWPTLTTLAESPRRAGVLYAGADDGSVQVTRDDGGTWTNISGRFPGVPKGTYVARLVASRFEDGRAYAAFDGHRTNDFGVYLFATEDYGQTWRPIVRGIRPGHVIRTVAEDLKNPDVLYAGTEFGLFVSIDRGASWTHVRANVPTGPVYSIAQHPRENDLLLGTHSRGVWILDHVAAIQQAAEAARADAFLFDVRPARQFNRAFDRWWMAGDGRFWGHNPPFGAILDYHLRSDAARVSLRITDASGTLVRELQGEDAGVPGRRGYTRATWDLRYAPAPQRPGDDPPPPLLGREQVRSHMFQQIERTEAHPHFAPFVLPGQYRATLVVDGREAGARQFVVEPDWLVEISDEDRRAMHDTALALHRLHEVAIQAADVIDEVSRAFHALDGRTAPAREGALADQAGALHKRLADLRRQFGVADPATGRAAGGFGALPNRISGLKTQVMGSTSRPTQMQVDQTAEVRDALQKAVDDTNDVALNAWPAFETAARAVPSTPRVRLAMPGR